MEDPPAWDFSDRDIAILKELAREPQLSSRTLADRLEEEYDISVSHVTVSETVREMREEGVFRDALLINEQYFDFALFEFKFDPGHFEAGWRDAMEYIRDDEHTLFYFLAQGEYQWKTIMLFTSHEAQSRWIHEFYKEHGDVVDNVRSVLMHNVLKFQTDSELLEKLR